MIRSSRALIDAVTSLGRAHGLSANSEVVAAVLEFLPFRQRTIARRNILVARLGQPLADQVLANVKRVGIEPVKQPRFCD